MGFRDSLLDGRRDLWDPDGLLLEVFEKGVHFADHDAMAALVTRARRWVEWMFGLRQMWELGGGSLCSARRVPTLKSISELIREACGRHPSHGRKRVQILAAADHYY